MPASLALSLSLNLPPTHSTTNSLIHFSHPFTLPSLSPSLPDRGSAKVPTGRALGLAAPTASASASLLTDDVKLMIYMGVDCVMEVFAVHAARTRDFCNMFQKHGLLKYLSVAFQRIFELHRASTVGCNSPFKVAGAYKRWPGGAPSAGAGSRPASTSGGSVNSGGEGGAGGTNAPTSAAPTLGWAGSSSGGGGGKGHRRFASDASDFSFTGRAEVASLLDSECTLECRYLNCIASVFLNFSRSEAAVAVGMAREAEVLNAIILVLQVPPSLMAPPPGLSLAALFT